MERPVPAIMHFVWAKAHHPPKEVQTMHIKKVADEESVPFLKRAIPLVSSMEGRNRFVNRPFEIFVAFARDIRMEKSMI